MMKIKLIALSLFLSLIVSLASADTWLSFGASTSPGGSVGDLRVMKIDSLGNVTMNPVVVLNNSECQGCAGVMTDGDPGQIVFSLVMNRSGDPSHSEIARSVMNMSTLDASRPQNLGIFQSNVSWPVSIQTTQHAPRKFFVTEVNDNRARAFGITSQGLFDGTKWVANPVVSKGVIMQVGVAPDGGMSWAVNLNNSVPSSKIYLQALNASGLPTGSAKVGGSTLFTLGADISNLLPNGTRLLAYHDAATAQIQLTVVNGATGKKISPPRVLATGFSAFVQNIAMDAQGRFVVYSTFGACNRHELKFQALDGTGRASGAPKTLVACDSTQDFFLPDLLEN